MNRFKIYLLVMVCSFGSTLHAQQVAVKTDVLLDGLLTPNVGFEMVTGEKTSVGVSFMANYKPYGQHVMGMAVQPEWRYWFNGRPMTREFVGLTGLATSYSIKWKGTYYRGVAGGVGLTFGYNYNITRRLNIEGYFGFGAVAYRNRQHSCDVEFDDYFKDEETTVNHNVTGYVLMPTKLGIAVSYIIK